MSLLNKYLLCHMKDSQHFNDKLIINWTTFSFFGSWKSKMLYYKIKFSGIKKNMIIVI